jgi:tetratricopeptide (TPR) repeat protein
MSLPVFKKIQDLFQKKQLKKSIAELEQLLEANPNDSRVRLRLADLYSRAGLHAEALEQYKISAERLAAAGFQSRAIAIYKQIVRLDPHASYAVRRLAQLSRQQGLLADALRHCTELARSLRDAPEAREGVAIFEGLAAIEFKSLEDKLALAEEALAEDAKGMGPYERVCGLLNEMSEDLDKVGDVRIAAQWLCEKYPGRWQSFEILARALSREGERQGLGQVLGRLEQVYREAGVLGEKAALLESLRGKTGLPRGAHQEGEPEVEHVLSAVPLPGAETPEDQIKIKMETGLYDILKRKAGEETVLDKERAEQAVQEVGFQEIFQNFKNDLKGKIPKGDYETHYNLGVAYREMSLHEDAIREFRIAMEDPRLRYDCYFLIGQSLMELGRPEAAIDCYEKGLSMDGLSTEKLLGLTYELALALVKAGKKQEALKQFTRIAQLRSDYRDVAEHIRALQDPSNA